MRERVPAGAEVAVSAWFSLAAFRLDHLFVAEQDAVGVQWAGRTLVGPLHEEQKDGALARRCFNIYKGENGGVWVRELVSYLLTYHYGVDTVVIDSSRDRVQPIVKLYQVSFWIPPTESWDILGIGEET